MLQSSVLGHCLVQAQPRVCGTVILAGLFGSKVLVCSVVQLQLGRLEASLGNKTQCLGILCIPDGMVDIEQ